MVGKQGNGYFKRLATLSHRLLLNKLKIGTMWWSSFMWWLLYAIDYCTTYLPWNLRCFCNSFNTIQVTLFPIGIASSSSELVELFKGWTVIRKFNQCMIELFKGWTFWYIPLSESSTKVWSNFLKVEPTDTFWFQIE